MSDDRPISKAIFLTLLLMVAIGATVVYKQKVRGDYRLAQLEEEIRAVKEQSSQTIRSLSSSFRSVSDALTALHINVTTPVHLTDQTSIEMITPVTPVRIPVKGFHDGQRLFLVIVPTHTSSARFQVNFMKDCQYFLHFNPRYGQQSIVRNSATKCNSKWVRWDYSREEKKHNFDGYPFQKNQSYTLEFISQNGKIEIFLNGKLLCNYAERYPGAEIDMIEITEDVTVQYVRLSML